MLQTRWARLTFIVICAATLWLDVAYGQNQKPKSCFQGLYSLFPSLFPQGRRFDKAQPRLDLAVKSLSIFDQFKTLALFDALRFSDTIACQCAILDSIKNFKTKEESLQCMSECLKANQNELIFFIQADVRQALTRNLELESSPWKFGLQIDKKILHPSWIKACSHTEYTKALFGNKYSKKKNLYKIAFALPSNSVQNAKIRQEKMLLLIRSSQQERKLCWQLGEN